MQQRVLHIFFSMSLEFYRRKQPQNILSPKVLTFIFLFLYFLYFCIFWTSPDSQYQNQTDYIFCSQRWKNSIQSVKRPRADCGSDHQLVMAKFRLKLKKAGKTLKSFMYDLSQIPYDYTMEVTIDSRDQIWQTECLKNNGQRFVTLYRKQGSRPTPRKRNAKRRNCCLRRPYNQLRKEKKLQAKEKRKDILI